jgi:hypothetical protein
MSHNPYAVNTKSDVPNLGNTCSLKLEKALVGLFLYYNLVYQRNANGIESSFAFSLPPLLKKTG